MTKSSARPYHNGGLFERNALDQQGIVIGDHIIAALLSPDGLFNRYNFTVTETTPLDTEAVVRPGGTKYDAVGYELSG